MLDTYPTPTAAENAHTLPATGAELLDRTATEASRIGVGGRTNVFEFDKVMHEKWPFALRVHGIAHMGVVRKAIEQLDRTSSLTPVETLAGMNIGQALASVATANGSTIQLVARVPGFSLKEWHAEAGQNGAVDTALKLLAPFEHATAGKNNPLLSLFEQIYRLRFYHKGERFALNSDNIMYDAETQQFCPIDLEPHPGDGSNTHADTVSTLRELSGHLRDSLAQRTIAKAELATAGDTPQVAQYEAAYQHFNALIKDAEQQIALRYEHKAPPQLAFRKATISAVTLQSPPNALREDLKRMQAELDIPGRQS